MVIVSIAKMQLAKGVLDMKYFGMLVTLAVISLTVPSHALTLKKGQVIGGDGGVYDGASPQAKKALMKQAVDSGKSSGITGNNLFVVVEGTVTFIPLSELSGKSEQGIEDLVVGKVTETMLSEFDIDLAAEELEAASDEEINAAFARIADADVAGIAAVNVTELTKDAWKNISREDLAEATAYAAEFAAREAASIAASEALADGLLDDLENGDISLEQAIEQASQDPNYDGHCYDNC